MLNSAGMYWLGRHRFLILALICFFWTGVISLGHFLPGVPFISAPWRGEQSFEDLLRREGRKTSAPSDFVFLGIDQSTLQLPPLSAEEIAGNRAFQLMTEKPFPWSREVWVLVLDRLFAAGARVVMFDMIFSPPNDGDPAFHAALDRYHDKVVLGANFDMANSAQAVTPNNTLIPPPQLQDDRVGFVNFWTDPIDGKIRAATYRVTDRQLAGLPPDSSEEVYQSLSARALDKIGHANDVPHDFRGHMIRFTSPDAFAPRPLYEVFDPKFWHANYADGAFFKDKIVMVGSSAQVEHDFVVTPISPTTLGPALHLQAMAAAMNHEFLRPTPAKTGLALVAAAGLMAWSVVGFLRRPLLCLGALVVITGAYLGAARFLYDKTGLLLLTVPVLSALLLSGLFSLGLEYAIERLEKLRTRRTLERYVSKNLVKEVLENPDSYYSSLRGVRVPATVLFSDLIGFTTLAEKADPEALVSQLNEYLSRMTSVVFSNGGTLDKFIGDAIMAVWGNVRSFGMAQDAKNCVRAALGMRRELRQLNQKWREEGRMGLGMGIGINQGEVVVGNIGSHERMDPTVIGDSVNLASRLEGLTRIYGVDILVGASAAELARDEVHLRSVARVQVKGKSKPVDVFTFIGARNEEIDPEFLKWLETYEEGLELFRARDFTEAKILFSRFLEFYPDDLLAKMYLNRALEYEQAPPDEAWEAVEVFEKK
ncbi:MAG TPA: adenylate/guanylate cyclase domain-containing protein [Candidatus Dormibacteraeota bacterium]|nr:adenylate/guanylate cyclase domain-containing protein [Candidatus Dormibacteraeota bacterium]